MSPDLSFAITSRTAKEGVESAFDALNQRVVACERCPRLRRYCAEIAQKRRRAYRDEIYWGRPVPSFGDPAARVLILGLAPGAHGSNRTGRPFTGDGSGDFLYPVLYEAGFASQPGARSRDDGMRLSDVLITSVGRCAPPDNTTAPPRNWQIARAGSTKRSPCSPACAWWCAWATSPGTAISPTCGAKDMRRS